MTDEGGMKASVPFSPIDVDDSEIEAVGALTDMPAAIASQTTRAVKLWSRWPYYSTAHISASGRM
jgi:hypothetical protein